MPYHTPQSLLKSTLLLGLLTMTGCASEEWIKIGGFVNHGDQAPILHSKQLKAGQLDSLSEGEAIALASGSDNAVARPDYTELVIYKTIKRESKDSNSELEFDLDGDGICDLDCFAWQQKNQANFFALSALKFVRNSEGQWVKTAWLDRDLLPGKTTSIQYRLILLNSGNKPFNGKLTAYDKLDAGLSFSHIVASQRVADHRDLKAGLAYIPYLGYAVLAMDDFSIQGAGPTFTSHLEQQMVKFDSAEVSLEPGDGVMLDFAVNVQLP